MDSVKVASYAKINLTLDVISKRSDGYHDLRSIMQSITLPEVVTLKKNSLGGITLECDTQGVPLDKRNIAYKCAQAFFEAAKITNSGLDIQIQKKIPIQAGLAGGSADGAAVLYGLNEMYSKPLSDDELINTAKNIGADIPFCLTGGTALAEGIGEKLTKLSPLPKCYLTIVKPEIGISTAQAYGAVDSKGMSKVPSTDKALPVISDLPKLAKALHNDFEAALSIEGLQLIKNELLSCDGCLGACMSGSGSACFAIFDDKARAEQCTSKMQEKYLFSATVEPAEAGVEIIS